MECGTQEALFHPLCTFPFSRLKSWKQPHPVPFLAARFFFISFYSLALLCSFFSQFSTPIINFFYSYYSTCFKAPSLKRKETELERSTPLPFMVIYLLCQFHISIWLFFSLSLAQVHTSAVFHISWIHYPFFCVTSNNFVIDWLNPFFCPATGKPANLTTISLSFCNC